MSAGAALPSRSDFRSGIEALSAPIAERRSARREVERKYIVGWLSIELYISTFIDARQDIQSKIHDDGVGAEAKQRKFISGRVHQMCAWQ